MATIIPVMNKMNRKQQTGQALTETLVTASTVLVPLLLLIPLLGKYIDIKHATIQAARYEAWEYTVWYSNNAERTGPWSSGERSSGFEDLSGSDLPQPVKSTAQLQRESRQRFFSQTTMPITSSDKATGWNSNNARQLWHDHRGNRLWDGDIPSGTTTRSSEGTPDYSGGVLNTLLDIIDAVFGAIAAAMKLIGSGVGFTAINTDGLSKSDLVVPVNAPVGLIDFATITDTGGVDDSTAAFALEFEAGAAVLTDGWNSGGLRHTVNQVGGITPTKILDSLVDTLLNSVPGLGVAWDIVTLLIPEWRRCDPSIDHFLDVNYGTYADFNSSAGTFSTYSDGSRIPPKGNGSLWLGYINIDAVHPDRLESGGSHDCPDGICNFDPEPVFADCEI